MHEQYMRLALQEARQAAAEDEVPVGAVIISPDGSMIAAAHNRREQQQDPTAHAEVTAIQEAAKNIGSWRLENCTLCVTLEPCPMCAGAILQARIKTVIYGAADPKAGAAASLYKLLTDNRLNHRCEVIAGVLADPCGQILTQFFRTKRG